MDRPNKETQAQKSLHHQQVIGQKVIPVILVLTITIRNQLNHQTNLKNMMTMMTMITIIQKKNLLIQVVSLKLMLLLKYQPILLKSFQVKSISTMTL